MPSVTSFHEVTGRPLMLVIREPAGISRSASAPGGTISSITRPTVVEGSICRPFLAARKENASQANSAFIVTPARITTIRFHTGFASNTRSGGTAASTWPPSSAELVTSSSRLAIFT